MARRGYSHIYMATYFTDEPDIGLVRFIVRIPNSLLPNGPTPSEIYKTDSTIEASDDGAAWRVVKKFPTSWRGHPTQLTVVFEPVTARHFRLLLPHRRRPLLG